MGKYDYFTFSSNELVSISPPLIAYFKKDKSNFFTLLLLISASNKVGTPKTIVGLFFLNNISN